MARKLLFFIITMPFFFGLVSPIFPPAPGGRAGALEKVKLGTSVKMVIHYYLPPLTAEERGFWKENGLEVEWVPLASGAAHFRAVAAGAITIGLATAVDPVLAAERGVPVIMASELVSSQPWYMWVRADSPYRHPVELKGARVGVTALGSVAHALGRIMVGAHGIEKEVRFVGAGGTAEQLAGLRAGAFDAIVTSLGAAVGMKTEGIVRGLVSTADYVPKPWIEQVVFARKEFARSNPDVVRRMLKATLQSLDFVRKNPRWAKDKIKSFQGLSEEAAKEVYEDTRFTITGRLDRRAVENVRKVFIEYGIITEKAPAVDELFTNEYVP